jgi:hypothetical protein
MRRSVLILTLIAVCALLAAPASAQVQTRDWFANAAVGPSFGTFGSTPVVDASVGYTDPIVNPPPPKSCSVLSGHVPNTRTCQASAAL